MSWQLCCCDSSKEASLCHLSAAGDAPGPTAIIRELLPSLSLPTCVNSAFQAWTAATARVCPFFPYIVVSCCCWRCLGAVTLRTRGGRGVPMSLLPFPFPWPQSVCMVVAVSVLCWEPPRTLRSHFLPAFWLSGSPGLVPSVPGMQGWSLWVLLCGMQPAACPALGASWSPARSPALPGHHLPAGTATATQKGFSSLHPLPAAALPGPGQGHGALGNLSRARIWAVFISLKISARPGLQTLPRSS